MRRTGGSAELGNPTGSGFKSKVKFCLKTLLADFPKKKKKRKAMLPDFPEKNRIFSSLFSQNFHSTEFIFTVINFL